MRSLPGMVLFFVTIQEMNVLLISQIFLSLVGRDERVVRPKLKKFPPNLFCNRPPIRVTSLWLTIRQTAVPARQIPARQIRRALAPWIYRWL